MAGYKKNSHPESWGNVRKEKDPIRNADWVDSTGTLKQTGRKNLADILDVPGVNNGLTGRLPGGSVKRPR